VQTIILTRDDFSSELHPNRWREFCEELGLSFDPETGEWPEEITLRVAVVNAN
jgi:hypothetical protein